MASCWDLPALKEEKCPHPWRWIEPIAIGLPWVEESYWAAARSVFLGGGDARAGDRLESTLKTQCLGSWLKLNCKLVNQLSPKVSMLGLDQVFPSNARFLGRIGPVSLSGPVQPTQRVGGIWLLDVGTSNPVDGYTGLICLNMPRGPRF